MYPPPSAKLPPATSPALVNEQPMYRLPIFGANSAFVATVIYHPPPSSISTPLASGVVPPTVCIFETPPSPDKLIHRRVLPSGRQEVAIILVAHSNLWLSRTDVNVNSIDYANLKAVNIVPNLMKKYLQWWPRNDQFWDFICDNLYDSEQFLTYGCKSRSQMECKSCWNGSQSYSCKFFISYPLSSGPAIFHFYLWHLQFIVM